MATPRVAGDCIRAARPPPGSKIRHNISEETGHTIPQIALNWLFHRPTVATVIIGARNEE